MTKFSKQIVAQLFYLLFKRVISLGFDVLLEVGLGRAPVADENLKGSKLFDVDDEAAIVFELLIRSSANSSTRKKNKQQ